MPKKLPIRIQRRFLCACVGTGTWTGTRLTRIRTVRLQIGQLHLTRVRLERHADRSTWGKHKSMKRKSAPCVNETFFWLVPEWTYRVSFSSKQQDLGCSLTQFLTLLFFSFTWYLLDVQSHLPLKRFSSPHIKFCHPRPELLFYLLPTVVVAPPCVAHIIDPCIMELNVHIRTWKTWVSCRPCTSWLWWASFPTPKWTTPFQPTSLHSAWTQKAKSLNYVLCNGRTAKLCCRKRLIRSNKDVQDVDCFESRQSPIHSLSWRKTICFDPCDWQGNLVPSVFGFESGFWVFLQNEKVVCWISDFLEAGKGNTSAKFQRQFISK